MSFEFLLLLAVVALLPLIRQLLQAAQQRDPRTPERAETPPPRKPQTPIHASPPSTLAIPVRPEVAPGAMTARGRRPAQDAAGPLTVALAPYRIRRRRTAADLRNHLHLRRAIVLMAILGPCRAINPYDWPERAVPE